MEIIKTLKDYTNSPLGKGLYDYMINTLDSVTCREPIKNIEFMLQYVKPVHDFVIYTNAKYGANSKRLI